MLRRHESLKVKEAFHHFGLLILRYFVHYAANILVASTDHFDGQGCFLFLTLH